MNVNNEITNRRGPANVKTKELLLNEIEVVSTIKPREINTRS